MWESINQYYNLSNPQDLQSALLQQVNAYTDYFQYRSSLEELIEAYDETLEDSDFASWLNYGANPENADRLGMAAMASLRQSAGLFDEILERAKKNLSFILKAALTASSDIQVMVWGEAYSVEPGTLDSLLSTLFDEFVEVGFDNAGEDRLGFFLDFMKKFFSQDT